MLSVIAAPSFQPSAPKPKADASAFSAAVDRSAGQAGYLRPINQLGNSWKLEWYDAQQKRYRPVTAGSQFLRGSQPQLRATDPQGHAFVLKPKWGTAQTLVGQAFAGIGVVLRSFTFGTNGSIKSP